MRKKFRPAHSDRLRLLHTLEHGSLDIEKCRSQDDEDLSKFSTITIDDDGEDVLPQVPLTIDKEDIESDGILSSEYTSPIWKKETHKVIIMSKRLELESENEKQTLNNDSDDKKYTSEMKATYSKNAINEMKNREILEKNLMEKIIPDLLQTEPSLKESFDVQKIEYAIEKVHDQQQSSSNVILKISQTKKVAESEPSVGFYVESPNTNESRTKEQTKNSTLSQNLEEQSICNQSLPQNDEIPSLKPQVPECNTAISIDEKIVGWQEMNPWVLAARALKPTPINKSKEKFKKMLKKSALRQFYKCIGENCSFTTNSDSTFKRHLEKYHFEKLEDTLVCPYCSYHFKTVKELITHYEFHMYRQFSCSLCFYSSISPETVYCHMRTFHHKDPLKRILKMDVFKTIDRNSVYRTRINNKRKTNIQPLTCESE